MKKDNAYIIAAIITSLEAVGVALSYGLTYSGVITDEFWFWFPMWIVPAVCVAGLAIYGVLCLFITLYIHVMLHKECEMDYDIFDEEEKKDDEE